MTLRWQWAIVVAFAVVLAGLGAYVARNLRVTNDITSFLPEGVDPEVSAIIKELAGSELARSMIVTVGGPEPDEVADATRELRAALADNPRVAWVGGGFDESGVESVFALYFSRRLSFWTDEPEKAASRLSDGALAEAARALKGALGSPLGALVRRIAPEDPLLVSRDQLDRLRRVHDTNLHVRNGQLMTADERYGVLFLASRAGPFDSTEQAQLLASLDDSFATVNRVHGGRLTLESSGVNRFAMQSEKSIRADIQRISALSTIGVVVLFVAIFRSLRYVVLGMVPLVAGTLCAMAVSLKVFGTLHGITLAFGSSLIGVGIDYAEHYFSHHTVSPHPDGPVAGFERLWPGSPSAH